MISFATKNPRPFIYEAIWVVLPPGAAQRSSIFSSPLKENRRSFRLWPLLAAACIAAFAFIILMPPEEENMAIAYVDGKMLNNEVQAMQMGQEALQEIFSNGNQEQQLSELFNEP